MLIADSEGAARGHACFGSSRIIKLLLLSLPYYTNFDKALPRKWTDCGELLEIVMYDGTMGSVQAVIRLEHEPAMVSSLTC